MPSTSWAIGPSVASGLLHQIYAAVLASVVCNGSSVFVTTTSASSRIACAAVFAASKAARASASNTGSSKLMAAISAAERAPL